MKVISTSLLCFLPFLLQLKSTCSPWLYIIIWYVPFFLNHCDLYLCKVTLHCFSIPWLHQRHRGVLFVVASIIHSHRDSWLILYHCSREWRSINTLPRILRKFSNLHDVFSIPLHLFILVHAAPCVALFYDAKHCTVWLNPQATVSACFNQHTPAQLLLSCFVAYIH
jgi:hypothetical protein